MQDNPLDKNDSTKKIGSAMVIGAWIVVLILATLYFDRFLDAQHNPNQQAEYSETATKREVLLQRNRQGHYLSNGKINNIEVSFLLDTGATDVNIPEHVANRLGLKKGRKVQASTANGIITVSITVLDRVQLGNIVLQNVRASINPFLNEDEILLGMTFLKHLEFTQRGDQLILRQYN